MAQGINQRLKYYVITESVLSYMLLFAVGGFLMDCILDFLDVAGEASFWQGIKTEWFVLTYVVCIVGAVAGGMVLILVCGGVLRIVVGAWRKLKELSWGEWDALDWYLLFRPDAINRVSLLFKNNGEEFSREEYVSMAYHQPTWSGSVIDWWKRSSINFLEFPDHPISYPSPIKLIWFLLSKSFQLAWDLAWGIATWVWSLALLIGLPLALTRFRIGEVDLNPDVADFEWLESIIVFIAINLVYVIESFSLWPTIGVVYSVYVLFKIVRNESDYRKFNYHSSTSNLTGQPQDAEKVAGVVKGSMGIRKSIRYKSDWGYYEKPLRPVLARGYNLYSTCYSLRGSGNWSQLRVDGPSVSEVLRQEKESFSPVQNVLFDQHTGYYLPPFSTLPFFSFMSRSLKGALTAQIELIDSADGGLVMEFCGRRLAIKHSNRRSGLVDGFIVDVASSYMGFNDDGTYRTNGEGDSFLFGTKVGEGMLALHNVNDLDENLLWFIINWKDFFDLRLKIKQVDRDHYVAFIVLGPREFEA